MRIATKEPVNAGSAETLGLRDALHRGMIEAMKRELSARFAPGIAAVLALSFFCLPAGRPAVAGCSFCLSTAQADEIIYSAYAVNEGNFNVTGVVQGVSYPQNVIEVLVAGAKQSIHIAPTTAITKHGETGSIADIRVGTHVRVAGIMRDGQRVAVTIDIK
jgi:hypothetical protein